MSTRIDRNPFGTDIIFRHFLRGLRSKQMYDAAGLASEFVAGKSLPFLHFASHSHQPWPDATRNAQLRYWDHSSRLLDLKWNHIFGQVIPEAQRHIARHLELAHPERIVFSPNTHEMLVRLFSCFAERRSSENPIRILTTDSEYHSALWQFSRWSELPYVKVEVVPVEPFESFEARFKEKAREGNWDMVYFSHVFFNSGRKVNDLKGIVKTVENPNTIIIIDGYHGFMAKPTSLKNIQDRVFYLAGGYKYAMAGEGVCFLYVPTHCPWNPHDIGWFGLFEHIQSGITFGEPMKFTESASKFWGATFDPSGLYRLNAAMNLFEGGKMPVEIMDAYVMGLQQFFLDKLELNPIPWLSNLITPRDLSQAGHFLTFRIPDAPKREKQLLREAKVIVDSRKESLRIGFGIYQDRPMVRELLVRARRIAV